MLKCVFATLLAANCVCPAAGTGPAAVVPPQPPAVDTDQGDAVAFRTITDEDVEGDDEFYDADEGTLAVLLMLIP